MAVQFQAYVFARGLKLVHEKTEHCLYFTSFEQAHSEFVDLLKDQEEMFGYVGAIEVKVIKTTSNMLHNTNVKILDGWKKEVAGRDFIKDLQEGMNA